MLSHSQWSIKQAVQFRGSINVLKWFMKIFMFLLPPVKFDRVETFYFDFHMGNKEKKISNE